MRKNRIDVGVRQVVRQYGGACERTQERKRKNEISMRPFLEGVNYMSKEDGRGAMCYSPFIVSNTNAFLCVMPE